MGDAGSCRGTDALLFPAEFLLTPDPMLAGARLLARQLLAAQFTLHTFSVFSNIIIIHHQRTRHSEAASSSSSTPRALLCWHRQQRTFPGVVVKAQG